MAQNKSTAKSDNSAKKVKELEKTIEELNAMFKLLMKQGASDSTVPGDRDVVFIYLCNNILNLSTEPYGGGTVYTFTVFG